MNLTDMMSALNEMGMLFNSESVERRQNDPLFHYEVTALSERGTELSFSGKISPNMLHNMELALEALRGRFVESLQNGDFPRVRGPNGMFVCEVCGNAYLETTHLDTHSRYAH